MADLNVTFSDTRVGDRVAEAQRQAALNQPTIGEQFGAAWRSESVTQAIIDRFHGPQFQPDPSYRMDPAWVTEEAKKRGLDTKYLKPLAGATSQAHALHMMDTMQQELKDRETAGFWPSLAVGVLDPVQLAGNIFTGGGSTLFTRGGRIARMVEGGLLAGGQNVLTEAALAKSQYVRDPEDLVAAGALGFAIGGGVAGLFGREVKDLKKAAESLYTSTTLRKVKREGTALTPLGERSLKASDTLYGEYVPAEPHPEGGLKRLPNGSVEGEWFDGEYVPAGAAPEGQRRLPRGSIEGEATRVPDDPALPSQRLLTGPDEAPRAGDNVEWMGSGGKVETGSIIHTNEKGQFLIEDASGKTRKFDQPAPKAAPAEAPKGARAPTAEESYWTAQADKHTKTAATLEAKFQKTGEKKWQKQAATNRAKAESIRERIKSGAYAPKADPAELEAARKAYHDIQAKAEQAYYRSGRKGNFREIEEELLGEDRAMSMADMNDLDVIKSATEDMKAAHEKWQGSADERQMAHTAKVLKDDIETDGDVPFGPGDEVEWTNAKGQLEHGRVHKQMDNGDYLIEDDFGQMRTFKHEALSDGVDPYGADDGVFGPDSVGAARVGRMSDLAADTSESQTALSYIKVGKFKIPLRFDYYARFQRSENPFVRQIGDLLLADGVGKTGADGARTFNASEFAELERQTYRGRFSQAAETAFDKYAERAGLNWADRLHTSEEATKFFRDVTKAVRGDADALARTPEVAGLASELRSMHKEILEKLKFYGVEGADMVDVNPEYMMRKFNHDNISLLVKNHGERVYEMVGMALRRRRPELDREKANRIGKAYIEKVRELHYEPMTGKAFITDQDKALLRDSFKDQNMDPEDIEDLMDLILGHQKASEADAGKSARMKTRTRLDENFEMSYFDADGNTQKLSMSDLFENDARVLFDTYTKQTTGLLGLAKVGIRSESDFTGWKRDATKWAKENFADAEAHKAAMQDADNIYNYILGRPMSGESFGKLERMARVMRDFNFFRLMGQAGFAQVAEIGNLVGLAGWRAMGQHMPEVAYILKAAKGRAIDDVLQRDLINLGGFGSEVGAHHPLMRDINELEGSHNLTKAEMLARKAAHATNYMSGMAGINTVLKNVAGRAFAQKFVDMALGNLQIVRRSGEDLPEVFGLNSKELKRLASVGLDRNTLTSALRDLKKYATVEGPTHKLTSIDYEAWSRANPDTYDAFRIAMFRETRRAVQEQTIGETAWWMHTSVGKVLTQFRSFSLVAWNKQFLFGVNHMSPEIATAWGASMLFAGLSYVAQTGLNYAHSPKDLEQRLSIGHIAASSFQRAGFSSIMPMGISTFGTAAFNVDPFQFGRTTGQSTNLITGNPTYDLAFNKLYGTLNNTAQSFLTSDHAWTKNDIKHLGGLLPNLIGVRNLVHGMADEFPRTNPLRMQGAQ
jgi:hypothetical protein